MVYIVACVVLAAVLWSIKMDIDANRANKTDRG